MASIINTNISSITAQRNLATSQMSLATSMQRLSSGLRINSAKDDAAGLAISERFTTQIRGLNQASRNANDGISLAQTAEGALAEVTSNLQRIRELAVQSANATNSSADRAALDQEVQQRLSEIDRIGSQTSFNGQKILDGSFGNAVFQVGANVGETIGVNLATSVRATAIGKTADYVNATTAYASTTAVGQQGTGVTTSAITTGQVTIAVGAGQAVGVGVSVDGPAGATAGQTAGSAYAKVQAINAANVGGLTATANTTLQTAFTSTAALNSLSLTINGVGIYTTSVGVKTGSDVAGAINTNSSATGVTASFDSGNNRMTLTAADGRNIDIIQTLGGAGNANVGFNGTGVALGTNNSTNAGLAFDTALSGTTTVTAVGAIRLTAADTITVGGSSAATVGFGAGGSLALGTTAINSASVTSVANANDTIGRVDAALTSVSSLRSSFGAIQNRFDSVIASLSTTSENLAASRSRVQDADFAQETANLSRAQILQQAGTAMVAQANQLPQGVLALLR